MLCSVCWPSNNPRHNLIERIANKLNQRILRCLFRCLIDLCTAKWSQVFTNTWRPIYWIPTLLTLLSIKESEKILEGRSFKMWMTLYWWLHALYNNPTQKHKRERKERHCSSDEGARKSVLLGDFHRSIHHLQEGKWKKEIGVLSERSNSSILGIPRDSDCLAPRSGQLRKCLSTFYRQAKEISLLLDPWLKLKKSPWAWENAPGFRRQH